jgi:hypothetical protein
MSLSESNIKVIANLEREANTLLSQIAASVQAASRDDLESLERVAAPAAKIAHGSAHPHLVSEQMRALIEWTAHLDDEAWCAQFQKALQIRPLRSPFARNAMPQDVPGELQASINSQVLDHLKALSAHSDVAEVLMKAVKPLGDVQTFCPDPHEYRYVVVSTRNVLFGFAAGMQSVAFRLDERFKERALKTGGVALPACGPEWVVFEVFRSDWPKVDLEFWARKAYVFVRETQLEKS